MLWSEAIYTHRQKQRGLLGALYVYIEARKLCMHVGRGCRCRRHRSVTLLGAGFTTMFVRVASTNSLSQCVYRYLLVLHALLQSVCEGAIARLELLS